MNNLLKNTLEHDQKKYIEFSNYLMLDYIGNKSTNTIRSHLPNPEERIET